MRDSTSRQIDSVLKALREVLGADLVGAWLHGSAVLGGFRPDSDIDLLAMSRRRTTADEKRTLIGRLLGVSGRKAIGRPGRPIELDIVVESEITPWRYPPTFDFHFDELLRDRFEAGELDPWPSETNRDLASAITMVLTGGRAPLHGPPPTAVFEPVPREDYVHAVLRDIDTVDEYLPWDTRNVVLTLPRIWSAVATDVVHSKESAAEWALSRLPARHRVVLEFALAAYRGDAADSWDGRLPQARAYADHVVGEIRRMRGRLGRSDRQP